MTEYLEGAVEMGDAVVDDDLIDEGLHVVRMLWDVGLAHRDIKPANLMVRDGRIFLIDVAFAELRPTPWRQAIDLANMMLCLALRSSAQQVYDRALRQFTVEDVSEAFASARGIALPSQLRRALRAEGRDVHGDFLDLLPARPQPIKIQRWRLPTTRRRAFRRRRGGIDRVQRRSIVRRPREHPHARARRRTLRGDGGDVVAGAGGHTAELVPCVATLPVGWSFGLLTANNGRSTITVDHDRAGSKAIDLRFAGSCDVTGATEVSSDVPGAQRFERGPVAGTDTILTWYEVFPGGCTTAELSSDNPAPEVVEDVTTQAGHVIGFVPRTDLALALDERSDGRIQLDPPA